MSLGQWLPRHLELSPLQVPAQVQLLLALPRGEQPWLQQLSELPQLPEQETLEWSVPLP